MPQFAYEAMDPAGRRKKGQVDARSEEEAFNWLDTEGLTPISVRASNPTGPWWQREITLGVSRQLSPDDLMGFCESVSTGLSAQLPLMQALELAEAANGSERTRRTLRQLRLQIEDGATLSAAMGGATPPFSQRILAAVALGERSNRLGSVFDQLVESLQADRETRREIQQALIYPSILLLASLLVFGLLVFVLTPALTPLFSDGSVARPFAIEIMMLTRSVLLNGWPILLTTLAVGYLASVVFRKQMRESITSLMRKLPYLRGIERRRDTLAVCEAFELILSSGGTILDGLDAAAGAVQSRALRETLQTSAVKVSDGATLRATVLALPLIDPTSAKILAAGEAANQLQQVLVPTIVRLRKETKRAVDTMVKLLTPVITLTLGVLVGAIILSTISAILDLNNAVL